MAPLGVPLRVPSKVWGLNGSAMVQVAFLCLLAQINASSRVPRRETRRVTARATIGSRFLDVGFRI